MSSKWKIKVIKIQALNKNNNLNNKDTKIIVNKKVVKMNINFKNQMNLTLWFNFAKTLNKKIMIMITKVMISIIKNKEQQLKWKILLTIKKRIDN